MYWNKDFDRPGNNFDRAVQWNGIKTLIGQCNGME